MPTTGERENFFLFEQRYVILHLIPFFHFYPLPWFWIFVQWIRISQSFFPFCVLSLNVVRRRFVFDFFCYCIFSEIYLNGRTSIGKGIVWIQDSFYSIAAKDENISSFARTWNYFECLGICNSFHCFKRWYLNVKPKTICRFSRKKVFSTDFDKTVTVIAVHKEAFRLLHLVKGIWDELNYSLSCNLKIVENWKALRKQQEKRMWDAKSGFFPFYWFLLFDFNSIWYNDTCLLFYATCLPDFILFSERLVTRAGVWEFQIEFCDMDLTGGTSNGSSDPKRFPTSNGCWIK